MSGLDNAGAILGELEGSTVELGAASSDLMKKLDDDSEDDVKEDQLEDALVMAGAEISHEEAALAANGLMSKFDADGDGDLDQAELGAAMACADIDNDGVIEADEVSALAASQRPRVRFEPKVEAPPVEPVTDTQRAEPTKAVVKRLKRAEFLARVRGRRAARSTARKSEPTSSSQPHTLDHSSTQEERCAGLRITAGARGQQTRQALKQQQVEAAAAQALLNAWRAHKAQKIIKEVRAAVKLQAVVRGSNARSASPGTSTKSIGDCPPTDD